MKKFEMPVVVLNEMTMNESIAADCCYSVKVDGYVTTKTVLSGGEIGTYTTYPLLTDVINHFGTRANLPNYHYKLLTYADSLGDQTAILAGGQIDVDGGVLSSSAWPSSSVNILAWTKDGAKVDGYFDMTGAWAALGSNQRIIESGGRCDHWGECAFTKKTEMGNAHIGSQVRHLFGGIDWASPHVAAQYNS